MFVLRRGYKCTHKRDQRPSHPQSNILDSNVNVASWLCGGEAGEQQVSTAHSAIKIHYTGRDCYPSRRSSKQKTNLFFGNCSEVVFDGHNTTLSSHQAQPSHHYCWEERNYYPSFSPASVGWLGVTRHLTMAVHWLSARDCHLTVSIVTHTTGSKMYSEHGSWRQSQAC